MSSPLVGTQPLLQSGHPAPPLAPHSAAQVGSFKRGWFVRPSFVAASASSGCGFVAAADRSRAQVRSSWDIGLRRRRQGYRCANGRQEALPLTEPPFSSRKSPLPPFFPPRPPFFPPPLAFANKESNVGGQKRGGVCAPRWLGAVVQYRASVAPNLGATGPCAPLFSSDAAVVRAQRPRG